MNRELKVEPSTERAVRLITQRICGRSKLDPIAVADASDFILGPPMQALSPDELLASASITPYCIDPFVGDIILVELPKHFDLSSAVFIYEAQYRHGERVHRISIADFNELASRVATPALPILLHSTGRCGSTLLARTLGSVSGVTAISEPDVFSQMAMAGRPIGAAEQSGFKALYGSCLRFFLRNRTGPVVFKFRSIVCEHADVLAGSLPACRSIFLYRNAVEVARSYARVTGRVLADWRLTAPQQRAWARFAPLLASLDDPPGGYDLMAALWASPVSRYLETWPSGIWYGAIDYADLLRDPGHVVDALLADEEQPVAPLRLAPHIFARDAQADSHLATNPSTANPQLQSELASPFFSEHITASLRRIAPRLSPAMVMPGRLVGAGATGA